MSPFSKPHSKKSETEGKDSRNAVEVERAVVSGYSIGPSLSSPQASSSSPSSPSSSSSSTPPLAGSSTRLFTLGSRVNTPAVRFAIVNSQWIRLLSTFHSYTDSRYNSTTATTTSTSLVPYNNNNNNNMTNHPRSQLFSLQPRRIHNASSNTTAVSPNITNKTTVHSGSITKLRHYHPQIHSQVLKQFHYSLPRTAISVPPAILDLPNITTTNITTQPSLQPTPTLATSVTPTTFIIGYGSLIHPNSLHRSIPPKSVLGSTPIRLKNWTRAWNYNCRNCYSAVGARKSSSFTKSRNGKNHLTGVLIPIVKEFENQVILSLDEREKCYRRVRVNPADIEFVADVDEAFMQTLQSPDVNIYIYETLTPSPPTPQTPIPQSYLDIILEGCILISGHDFAEEFIATTIGWSHNYVNDRFHGNEAKYVRSLTAGEVPAKVDISVLDTILKRTLGHWTTSWWDGERERRGEREDEDVNVNVNVTVSSVLTI